MEIKEPIVKRITSKELPSRFYLILNYLYHTELSQFIVFFDTKENVLYVNDNVPKQDIHKFMRMVTFPGVEINDPDSPVADTVNYICEVYGYKVYYILAQAHQKGLNKAYAKAAEERAVEILPIISEACESDLSDIFTRNEHLVSCISNAGGKVESKTFYNLVGYSTKYVFIFAYLLGQGSLPI